MEIDLDAHLLDIFLRPRCLWRQSLQRWKENWWLRIRAQPSSPLSSWLSGIDLLNLLLLTHLLTCCHLTCSLVSDFSTGSSTTPSRFYCFEPFHERTQVWRCGGDIECCSLRRNCVRPRPFALFHFIPANFMSLRVAQLTPSWQVILSKHMRAGILPLPPHHSGEESMRISAVLGGCVCYEWRTHIVVTDDTYRRMQWELLI